MKKAFKQFSRFFVVGVNNTGFDFLVLNILMMVLNVYKGVPLIIFNLISFSLAVTNSYFVNNFWTFSHENNRRIRNIQYLLSLILLFIVFNINFFKNNTLFIFLSSTFFILIVYLNSYIIRKIADFKNQLKDFSKFVSITLGGVLINSGIFFILTTLLNRPINISAVIWANAAKAVATSITLFWNFLFYKFVIFKK